jgi:AraC-like DNA-binding protein
LTFPAKSIDDRRMSERARKVDATGRQDRQRNNAPGKRRSNQRSRPRVEATGPRPRPALTSTFGEFNIGPIRTVPMALRAAGVDPATVLRRLGLDPGLFEDERNRLPFQQGGRLLQACVEATGQPHFGLLASRYFELPMLGPLGYLMRNESTVHAALRALMLNLHQHDRGAAVGLTHLDSRRTALTYAVFAPDTPALDVIYDLSLMIGMRILRTLCGADWRPLEVRLAHVAPPDTVPYRQLFEAPVRFNAPMSMLVFESRQLEAPVAGADPELHRLLTTLLAERESAAPRSLSDRIRLALGTGVLAGTTSAAHIADLFSISQRSLRRHLARDGLTLKQLTGEARMVVARQLLLETDMPLADIAATLHYSDPTAFSRAFRKALNVSPIHWRGQQREPAKAASRGQARATADRR